MGDSTGGPSSQLIGVLICISVGAVLAATDEALAAMGEPRARVARDSGGRDASTAARYLEHGKAIHMRLLGGRILALVGTAILAREFGRIFAPMWAQFGTVAVAAMVYATMIGTASTVAERRASRVALPLLRYTRPLELLVTPFAAPLQWVADLVDRMFPPQPADDPDRVTEVVVEQIVQRGEELGSIDQRHAELLLSVLEFRETVAREVMVPRTSVVAIEVDTPLPDVIGRMSEEGHSRYPIFRGSMDHVVGVLYAKDLFRLIQVGRELEGKLEDHVRTPVFFAAESQKISDLLRQMQARHTHLAIVVDEYGGTSGMVTLEDIIEEIVGEIRDEHDGDDAPVKQIAPGRFMAKAEVSVHDLAEITGLRVPDGAARYESLGGMLIDLAGRVPRSGESIGIGDHDLIVRGADERRVTRVEVVERDRQLPPAA